MATKRQVITALRSAFPDVDVSTLHTDSERGVYGVIVSSAFEKRGFMQRQRLIQRALTKAFGKDGFANVGPLGALTPTEAETQPAGVN